MGIVVGREALVVGKGALVVDGGAFEVGRGALVKLIEGVKEGLVGTIVEAAGVLVTLIEGETVDEETISVILGALFDVIIFGTLFVVITLGAQLDVITGEIFTLSNEEGKLT